MKRLFSIMLVFCMLLLLSNFLNYYTSASENTGKVSMADFRHDPFGSPRPGRDATNVPLNTSFYIQLKIQGDPEDSIDLNSIEVQLTPESGEPYFILNKNQVFADGYFGIIKNDNARGHGAVTTIFIDSNFVLKPESKYTVKINAQSVKGSKLPEGNNTWSFTTAPKADTYQIHYSLDFSRDFDVSWHGRYFNGLVKADFDTIEYFGAERYDYLYSQEIRKKYPNAWTYFRDFCFTGNDLYDTRLLPTIMPNVVKEKETRRITQIKVKEEGVLLHVEDFFGHEQYGIESNRPLSNDYKAGDEILIADGENSVVTTVISVHDNDKTVLVSDFAQPPDGWKIDYIQPLPEKEPNYSPGLFPKGGTYLYRFNPVGTLVYYWGRVNHEFDRLVFDYGRKLIINFSQAPGDLSVDGNSWTIPKDYAQLHQVTYDLTTYLIDRYGDQTLDWFWSVFNEPDLPQFWRTGDWIELQKFYDYSSDAILKAFEDKGYDSDLVFIGGLELAAGQIENLRLHDFLAHCSPTAERSGALSKNAAYTDSRLDGKRSKRVEELCKANDGKGAPLDFISIHTYNGSEIGSEKIIKSKEIALEIDPVYYEDLWINNYESVPTWSWFTDSGASEWTLGNGYFPTWAADYFNRMLQKAKEDPKYSYGNGVLTIWGTTQENFSFRNDVVTKIRVGSGRNLRYEIIPKPIFHYINLISTMETNYWVFPMERMGGHTISGFASPGENDLRMVLYSHDKYDTQSRSDDKFEINLDLSNIEWDNVVVMEYQLDKENNSFYSYAVENPNKSRFSEKEYEQLLEMSSLKVSNKENYKVNEDGSLNLKLPLAANGVNFVVISEAKEDETPPETPIDTPPQTPVDTHPETPVDTPPETPVDTPSETHVETPQETPAETPLETSVETPVETPRGGDSSPPTGDTGIVYSLLILLISFAFMMLGTVSQNLPPR